MKKIFSLILSLSMILSVSTFSAQAALSGQFNVKFLAENESTEIDDISTLNVGDIFYLDINFKDANPVKSSAIEISWDSTVVQPVDDSGNTSPTAKKACTYRLHYDDEDEAYSAADAQINESNIIYETYTTETDTSALASGNEDYITVRFKVLSEGDAKFGVCTSKIGEDGMTAAGQALCWIPTTAKEYTDTFTSNNVEYRHGGLVSTFTVALGTSVNQLKVGDATVNLQGTTVTSGEATAYINILNVPTSDVAVGSTFTVPVAPVVTAN